MGVNRYIARMRGPEGALVGRLCDGTPSDVWHVAVAAKDIVHARAMADSLSPGNLDEVLPETDTWCIPALEPEAWRRWEEMVRDSRRRARGAEESPRKAGPARKSKDVSIDDVRDRKGKGRHVDCDCMSCRPWTY